MAARLMPLLALVQFVASVYFRGDAIAIHIRPQAHGRRAAGWKAMETTKKETPRFALDNRGYLDLTNETHPWKMSFAFDNSSFVIPSIPVTRKSGALVPGIQFVFTYRAKQILGVRWEYATRSEVEDKKKGGKGSVDPRDKNQSIPILYTWEQARGYDIEFGSAVLFASSTAMITVLFCMAITEE
jgi:hypothetical protein